jgi:F-box-like
MRRNSARAGIMGRTTTVHDLPVELLQRILAMLPHHEHIVQALMTCKAWCAPAVPFCSLPHA